MRVQFSPWQTCNSGIVSYKEVSSASQTLTQTQTKKRKGKNGSTTLLKEKEEGHSKGETLAISLFSTTSPKKKKKQQVFEPLVCVTQPHSIFLIGNNNQQNREYDVNQRDESSLVVSNSATWISKPGPFHAFLPEEHKQRRVVPAAFSSNDGDLIAAFQHNNTVLSTWDAKINTGPDDDNVNKIKLPNNLYGTSLQFARDYWLIGTLNDGSSFLLDCRCVTSKLIIAQMSPDLVGMNDKRTSTATNSSQETFLHCMASSFLPNGDLHVYVISEKKNKDHQLVVVRTFHVCLLADDDITNAAKVTLIRTSSVPLTLPPHSDTQTTDITQCHFKLRTACTLKKGSTVAILTQLGNNDNNNNNKSVYIHVLDIESNSMNVIAVPSLDHCNEKSAYTDDVSMGCVSPYHVAIACNLQLVVLDLRYNASIICQTDYLQVFGKTSKAMSMSIVQSDSSSHALALACVDTNGTPNNDIMLAYSTFCMPGQEISMANALASMVAMSNTTGNDTTSHWQTATTSKTCSVKLRSQKQMKCMTSYCTDCIETTSSMNGMAALTSWDSLFEEAMLDVQHAIQETKAVVKPTIQQVPSVMNGHGSSGKLIIKNGNTNTPHPLTSVMNGANGTAFTTKTSEKLVFGPNRLPRDLLLCAAEGSIRILIHQFLRDRNKAPSKTLNTKSATTTTNLSLSDNKEAAVQVFVKCCSLTKISMRQLDHIVSSETNYSCKSFIQFTCRAGLLKVLYFALDKCTEVSERDLVSALSYMVCLASFTDLVCFFSSMDERCKDIATTVVLYNGVPMEPPQDRGNKQIVSDDRKTGYPTTTDHDDRLLQKLISYSKQCIATSSSSDVSSKIKSRIVLQSSLFWSRFVVGKCSPSLNPSLLRSAIIHCLIMPSGVKNCNAQNHLELILLSMSLLLREVLEGKHSLLLLPNDGHPTGSNTRIVEWIEAVLDAIQFCYVVTIQESATSSSEDTSLKQVQNVLKKVSEQVQKLVLVDDMVSLVAASLLRGGKRRRGESPEGEMTTSKRHDDASKTIPPYSIERLRF